MQRGHRAAQRKWSRVWDHRRPRAEKDRRLIHRALNECRALRHDTHVGIGVGLTGSLEIDIDDDRLRLASPRR